MNSITWLDDSNTATITGGGHHRSKGHKAAPPTQNLVQTSTVGDNNSGVVLNAGLNVINKGKIKIEIEQPPVTWA